MLAENRSFDYCGGDMEKNMLIAENPNPEGLWISAYEAGRIEIDGQGYEQAVCLNGHRVGPLDLPGAEALDDAVFQAALAEAASPPEIILVGCGERQVFLHPRITARLAAAGIGLETMNTAAACRTYMILRGEGRRVWAWLWP